MSSSRDREHLPSHLQNPFDDPSVLESLSSLEESIDETLVTGSINESENIAQLNLNHAIDVALPIHEYRQEIIKTIRNNKCVVIQGSTGCGKTTQVPKLIITDSIERKKPINILVSQPRKIAAITNAGRVAQEMGVRIGALVGFQVSLHKTVNQVGEKTKILFCTTGVILQKLIRLQTMQMYTHIVLDEIHERTIEMDFLLILIRRFLFTNSPKTKIILMSATMNSEQFASYFSSNSIEVPTVTMNVHRKYAIKKYFLNQLGKSMSRQIIKYEKPGISEEMMQLAADIVFCHVQNDKASFVLVFLPGLYEIEGFEKVLLDKFDVFSNYQIVVLHSANSPDDQKLAFKRDDKPKIILSTNIAENSVTIPKVKVVIDFCLTKYLVASRECNLASLQLNWTSKTSSEQRAGRTGRVCDGIVYHMVDQNFYQNEMQLYTDPEMKRVPLERTVLKAKQLSSMTPKNFLAAAMDPPDDESIGISILNLKEVGAMARCTRSDQYNENDGDLTFLGRVLASLPCDIYIGKFIVLGYVYSVLKEAVIIGAGLAINGSIFKFDFKKPLEFYSCVLGWSDNSGSDLFAILNAYREWRSRTRSGYFSKVCSEQSWCAARRLDHKNLFEMKELVKEIRYRLEEHRIKLPEDDEFLPIHNNNEKAIMLKTCVAGAWFPFFFMHELPKESNEHEAYRTVNNKNVHNTVYLKDVKNEYTTLYNDVIKRAFVTHGICHKVENVEINYEAANRKIFVTFLLNKWPDKRSQLGIQLVDGTVVPEVYRSIKHKEISREKFKLHVMDHSSIRRYAEQVHYIEADQAALNQSMNHSSASSITVGINEMKGIITYVEHVGKFFFRPTGHKYTPHLKVMEQRMLTADRAATRINTVMELSHGEYVFIKFKGKMHRAIVIKTASEPIKFNLIDIGLITEEVQLEDVSLCPSSYKIELETPPRCFECKLTKTSPSFVQCPKQIWSPEANDYFREKVENREAKIEIFSHTDGIVKVTLFVEDININTKMIDAGYAIRTEEDYLSRLNNCDRRNSTELSFRSSSIFDSEVSTEKNIMRLEPPPGMSNTTITLLGPYSPLETQLKGVLGTGRQIKIDPRSVNSIILNGDLSKFTSRLYIAAKVTKNRNDGITMRDITLFPNCPGAAELLALIFCQKMVLKCNDDMSRYEMLQTGLGCDPNSYEALFPLHDTIIPIQVQITDSEIANINLLRNRISKLLYTPPKVDFPPLTEGQKYDLQKDVKNMTLSILKSNRNTLPHKQPTKFSWKPEKGGKIIEPTDPLGNQATYEMHNFPKLFKPSSRKTRAVTYNMADINASRERSGTSARRFECFSCRLEFNNAAEISRHLNSAMHNQICMQHSSSQ